MSHKTRNTLLWTVQGLLALLFLFAGISKLVMPVAAMQQGPIALPGWFLRFLGVAETLGALGLVLPGIFGIRQSLTPLAAACLIPIMVGATAITAATGAGLGALFPLIVGLLSFSVAYGRRTGNRDRELFRNNSRSLFSSGRI
jgi:hypothetical protein